MTLRNEIEPQWEMAKKCYPEILRLILAYTAHCDEYGDEDNVEYRKLETQLHQLTGKDMSHYNLWEWWEGEGAEVLAFRIALPNPIKVTSISKVELSEIVRRIIGWSIPHKDPNKEETFEEQWQDYLDDYYRQFIKINFKSYKPEYFNRQKDAVGNYYDPSVEEIVGKIWKENK